MAEFAVVALVLFYPVAVYVHRSPLFYLVGLVLFGFWLIWLLMHGSLPVLSFSRAAPFYLLLLAFFLSSLWSIAPQRTLFQATGLVAFAWIFYLANTEFIRGNVRWLKPVVCGVVLTISALYIVTYLRFGSVRVISIAMIEAVGTFSNVGAAMVLICIPYLAYLYRTRQIPAVAFGGLLALTIIILLASASRAAYLLGFGALLYVVQRSTSSGRRSTLAVATLVGIALVSFVVLNYFMNVSLLVENVVERGLSASASSTDVYGRIFMLREGLRIIQERPIIGIGFEAFPVHMETRYGYGLISHNAFLTGWAEVGLLGLLLILWLMTAAAARAMRSARRAKRARSSERELIFAGATAVTIALLHAMVRPQLDNGMYYVVLAHALSLPTLVKPM